MSKLNYSQIESAVAYHATFEGNSMSGVSTRGDGRYLSTGILPDEWRRAFVAADLDYVVYSYATPIGWVTLGGTVVIPDVKYSRTTSRGQTLLRSAWGHRPIVSTLDSKAA